MADNRWGSYLENLLKTIATYYYQDPMGSGTAGYATGTRWDPSPRERAIHLSLGQTPSEEAETRRHEGMHQLIDKVPNWSYIVQTQQPTDELHREVGLTYPRAQEVEENLIRQMAPQYPTNRTWADIAGGTSLIQRMLISHLKDLAAYGPQRGSFWGPEYDDRELRQGKGQNILPRFIFNPNLQDMRIPEMREIADLEVMRGKGDYNKTGQEFAPPPRKPKADEIKPTTRGIYSKESTGKKEPEPMGYTWADMVYYP